VKNWLKETSNFSLEVHNNIIRAFPIKSREDIHFLYEAVRVVSAGVQLGEIKGSNVIPSHALALSVNLNPKSFHSVELTWEDAIKFLRKESLLINDAPKDYLLVTYRHYPLGFVKNLGNRSNNLYPQEWRIRTGHLPETLKLL
jgi:NOL1/NOP2/fmu family ribosome biogenesis protein